jgi:hypothetical protein
LNEFLCDINWELIIATIAIIISVFSIYTQRKHNRLSFKPIPVVVKYNYTNVLRVRLWNKGTGPLIIKSYKVNGEKSLIDLMPPETKEFIFVEFIDNFKERAISPNDTFNMLEFKIRKDKDGKVIEGYQEAFDTIKSTLNQLEIYIEYEDVYGNLMAYKSDPLDFGEVFDEEK